MDRRDFGTLLAGAIGAAVFSPFPFRSAGGQDAPPGVNRRRLRRRLEEISRFGSTGDGGIDRPAYGDADIAAREYVRTVMREAGLEPSVDAAGNILGRRPGAESGLPPLMAGSHIDSVPNGGRFDGPLGVLAAVEAAQRLREIGVETRHPLEIVVFSNEEDGKVGSRALAGEVTREELDRTTNSGYTIRQGLERIGGDPERVTGIGRSRGDVAAFLELHPEQGAILVDGDLDIGVVQGIVGIKRWQVTITGEANHAGTTPMDQRSDALVAAARFVDTVHRRARSMEGRQVATVGRISAHPGAANVIPGRVEHTLEIRDLEMAKIDRVFDLLREEATDIAAGTGTEFEFSHYYTTHSAPTDPRLRDIVEEAARSRDLSTLRMPSGAGHDAQSIAQFAPVGMIFVPSVGGISHSPDELTRPEDVVDGGDVMLGALRAADGRDWTEA